MTKFPLMDGSPSIQRVNAYRNVYTQQGRFAYDSLRDDRVPRVLLFADELLAEVGSGVWECTGYDVPRDKSYG